MNNQASNPAPARPLVRFGVQTLLVGALVLSLAMLLAFWWIGLRIDSGAAAAATAVTLLVWLGLGGLVRRRFRFGLRAMLIGVTLVAVVLGLLGGQIRRVRQQRQTAEAITAAGGEVIYDYQSTQGNWTVTSDGVPLPNWLIRLAGEDAFARMRYVRFYDRRYQFTVAELAEWERRRQQDLAPIALHRNFQLTDAELAELTELPLDGILSLSLARTNISDASLERLSRQNGLTELDLSWTSVSDRGLVHLAEMKQLRRLYLRGTNVTDQGLARLQAALPDTEIFSISIDTSDWTPATRAAFDRLTQGGGVRVNQGPSSADGEQGLQIHFSHTELTVDRLEHLLQLPRVTFIWCNETEVSDADLAVLARLPDLVTLQLDGGQITSKGLGRLAGLTRLESLGLSRVQIDASPGASPADPQAKDAWIAHLETLPSLESLSIDDMPISAAGVRRLGRLRQLEQLYLGRRSVPAPGGMTMLQQMLPDTDIRVE